MFSEILNYLVTHEVDDETKTKLLEVLNPSYKVNMELRDFTDQYQYDKYLMSVELVDTYIESLVITIFLLEIFMHFSKSLRIFKKPDVINSYTDLIILIRDIEELGLTVIWWNFSNKTFKFPIRRIKK